MRKKMDLPSLYYLFLAKCIKVLLVKPPCKPAAVTPTTGMSISVVVQLINMVQCSKILLLVPPFPPHFVMNIDYLHGES